MVRQPVARKKSIGGNQRRYPRKKTQIKVKLTASDKRDLVFSATLSTRDVSLGGLFLESEFFIKSGTSLEAEFELPDQAKPVRVRGLVTRQERVSRQGGLRPGFALQFTEYIDDAKLSLTSYFIAPRVRQFVKSYRMKRPSGRGRSNLERMVDLVVAWEMDRFERGEVWITT